ncbi:vWA domain-containing protein [Dietzia cercidiphylli]|jgi:predicted metal-dependent peptidase|uniref:vWA domain-containing protein n=1 Tax=Dietzia cercidiphylli TaxID=498199 RepID=UPI003F80DD18
MRVRALDAGEREAFRLGRMLAVQHMPYWARALFALSPLVAPDLATFAVDARWRLYMDPDLLTGPGRWDTPTVAAVLLHEIGHLLRDHAGRAQAMPAPLAHTAWNYAGDAEINDDLLAAGVALPEGVVTPAALGCADGDVAEHYYAAICDESHPMHDEATAATGMDDAGCGSGAGCTAVAAEIGASDGDEADAPAGLAEAEAERVRTLTARDTVSFGSTGRGTVPAGITRWASDALTPAPVPWQTILAAAVRRSMADAAGRMNYTYSRPSRRQIPGIVRPAMRQPLVTVAVVVDTSGSMSPTELDEAVGQVRRVARTSGVAGSSVQVITCDAQATDAQRATGTGTVALTGGGGTDMRVGIAAAMRVRPTPDVVVVLTDGFTPWPEAGIGARLICGLIAAQPETVPDPPAWAARVDIRPQTVAA